ncbi:MAG TPA: oligosaccharide flippase family protein [Methylobacter sp.]|jgi:PST family polysaccharide transporter
MTKRHTYGQILKSSALIGSSSMLNIAIGIVRTKAMAMLLGPSGIGLMGLYGSITELTISIAGMGINSSGVRQIAEAVGSGDTEKIAQTTAVLRRISIFLGVLGAVFLIGFSGPVSTLTFGNDQHATAVTLLSIAVFFNLVSAGQGALIQGMRRISDMAKMGILGTLFGTFISILVVYFLREEGLALSLVLIAAMGILTSWWYSRKIHIQMPSMSTAQVGQEAAALLKLGFAFMASGLLMSGAAYAVRLIVVRKVGFDAAGLYQSAWALGGLYIGFILQSMGADFYPRLTAIAKDNAECNRVVNEQAHVSMLLAGPGIIATLTFAPLVIALFYSPKFEGAVEILRWLCLGMTLRVISWPMGFIIVAKNVQNLLIFSELAWTVVYLGLAWACVDFFGLKGAGIAFFGSYVFHVLIVYVFTRRLSGFLWSSANLQTSFLYLALIGVVFCSYYALPPLLAMGIGTLAVLLSSVYSIQVFLNLMSLDRIPRPILKSLQWLRLTPSGYNEFNTYKTALSDSVVQNKPFIDMERVIFVFMVCALFSMWVHWYEGSYGWPAGLDSFESKLEMLLSIFHNKINSGI